MTKKRPSFFPIFPIICITLVAIGLLGMLQFLTKNTQAIISPLTEHFTIERPPTPTPTPGPKPLSVLLMGYGGLDHEGGYITDTLMQVVLKPNQRQVLLISIPRDLAVKIPVSETQVQDEKINAAFAIAIDDKNYPAKPKQYKGSTNPGALSKELVAQATGIPIDSYIAVSFDGFIKAIDILGGVDVTFAQSFDDYRYPIKGKEKDTCGRSEAEVASLSAALKGDPLEAQFSCRYEQLHVERGTQHLDGLTALKVARSRHSGTQGGDFSRSDRQRAILQAVKERVFKIGFLPKAIPFFVSLSRDLKTDIDVGKLTALLPYAEELRSYQITSIALTDKNVLTSGYNSIGQYVLIPTWGEGRWDQLQSFVASESTKSANTR